MVDKESPKRRIQLGLKMGADSWDDIVRELREITRRAEDVRRDENPSLNTTSGGYGSGYNLVTVTNEEQNHEQYFNELEAWLSGEREKHVRPTGQIVMVAPEADHVIDIEEEKKE